MQTPSRKGILTVLLVLFLGITVAVVPDIISDEMRTWCANTFGDGYQRYLLAFFVLGSVVLLFLTTDIGKWLTPRSDKSYAERYNIPPGPASRNILNQAKTAISQGETDEALLHLSGLRLPNLNAEIDLLSSRLVEYRRMRRYATETPDSENRTLNRINRDSRDLISVLEKELAAGTGNYDIIRLYLKKRYTNRLEQKLAGRQPVNLRRLVNLEVMSEGMRPAFVSYNSKEVGGALLHTFHEAQGRLLLVGAPGAGKTTLMLQLVLELLDTEPDTLPILLNLATWSRDYITLDTWLKKILPAETGTSDRYAAEILQQKNLILLFDGFDEIREEDRYSCLEAINRYGEDSQRRYVISSRNKEFQEENKGVLVGLPIEVCPLSFEQLRAELQRLSEHSSHPERGANLLLDALEKDTLLREVVETPFYFNILQILFNGGMALSDLQFETDTVEGRQTEIKECFVEYEMKAHIQHSYPAEKVAHWLAFLASRMTERNMVVFELRDLQYDWWNWSRIQLIPYNLISVVIYFSMGGMLVGLLFSPVLYLYVYLKSPDTKMSLISILNIGMGFGFILGTAIGLIIAVIAIAFKKTSVIETKEELNLSFSAFLKIFSEKCKRNNFQTLYNALFSGLIFYGISRLRFEITSSILWAVMGSILIWLISAVVATAFTIINESLPIIQIKSPYHRFNDSYKNLHYSIFQNELLRYQLYKLKLLPRNLVQFLNEMSLRHILEFDGDPRTGEGGGAWRFRHRILQEYFAEKWVEPEDYKL